MSDRPLDVGVCSGNAEIRHHAVISLRGAARRAARETGTVGSPPRVGDDDVLQMLETVPA